MIASRPGAAAPWRDPDAEPYLRIEKVTKRFGTVVALDAVSLGIHRGELFALLGGSGSGKTTLLRVLAGFAEPDEGRVVLDGQDLAGIPAYARPVNMMFQSYALFPHLDVVGNVGYGLRMSGLPRERARERAIEALRGVGLVGFDTRLPGELSGGQQQRVALARALVLEPRVLLFDEPLSNLDARLRRSMRDEIRALQQRLRLTVAYVTHDQSEALAVSDRIIVMDAGRIAQHDTPQSLYEQPASEFVARFMGEAALFDGEALVDGRVRLGPLHWRPRRALPPGAVRVAVRPEAWSVAARDDGGLPGTVQKCAYLGGTQELTIATALGEVFVAWPQPEPPWTPGQAVWLHLSDHGVSVLPQVPPVACGRGR